MVVSIVAPGRSKTRFTRRAQRATGSWSAWPFLCWVTVSKLLSFFWFTNVMETVVAVLNSLGFVIHLLRMLKTTLRGVMIFVFRVPVV